MEFALYTEYMFNLYEEEAKITVFDNDTCRVDLENGFFSFFENFDKATSKLERMGYRF